VVVGVVVVAVVSVAVVSVVDVAGVAAKAVGTAASETRTMRRTRRMTKAYVEAANVRTVFFICVAVSAQGVSGRLADRMKKGVNSRPFASAS
jgi:hypothetical protein